MMKSNLLKAGGGIIPSRNMCVEAEVKVVL